MKDISDIRTLDAMVDYLNEYKLINPEDDCIDVCIAYTEYNEDSVYLDGYEEDYIADEDGYIYLSEDGFRYTDYCYIPDEKHIATLIKAGGVYTSNADPAYTCDHPSDISLLLYLLNRCGFEEIRPSDERYDEAKLKLDLDNSDRPIYKIDNFLFAAL